MTSFFRFVTEPRYAAYIFAGVLVLVYGVSPLLIDAFVDPNPYMQKIGVMACVAGVVIVISRHIPVFDFQFGPRAWRLPIPANLFQLGVWGFFAAFVIVTFATADGVPLWSALFGDFSANELEAQRGAFLKTREGWAAMLPYISAVFAGAVLPYALSRLFFYRSRFRWIGFAAFIFYSISHLQKALFIQVVAPLFYLAARRLIWTYVGLVMLLVGSVGLVYLNTVLARGVQDEANIERLLEEREQRSDAIRGRSASAPKSDHDAAESMRDELFFPPYFFRADFRPVSAGEHMLWRIVSVPIFTASDALAVLDRRFDNQHLYGATSSFVAAAFGLERVNFDAEVHGYQWGDMRVGRSNSVFLTDAYVNFGWAGVIVFSLFVGQAFRWFAISTDEAFRSMWPLFAYNIIQASLIGSLLSSGFAVLFFIGLFCRFTSAESHQPESRP